METYSAHLQFPIVKLCQTFPAPADDNERGRTLEKMRADREEISDALKKTIESQSGKYGLAREMEIKSDFYSSSSLAYSVNYTPFEFEAGRNTHQLEYTFVLPRKGKRPKSITNIQLIKSDGKFSSDLNSDAVNGFYQNSHIISREIASVINRQIQEKYFGKPISPDYEIILFGCSTMDRGFSKLIGDLLHGRTRINEAKESMLVKNLLKKGDNQEWRIYAGDEPKALYGIEINKERAKIDLLCLDAGIKNPFASSDIAERVFNQFLFVI